MGVTKVAAMRALVVYESMFGNTRAIAEAVADELREVGEAEVCEVASAPTTAPDVDLVVVGGPTHAFGMTRSSTRQSAREQAPDGVVVSEAGGVREWLHALPTATKHPCAAAFDTRVAPAGSRFSGQGHREEAPRKGFRRGGATEDVLGVRHAGSPAGRRARSGSSLGTRGGSRQDLGWRLVSRRPGRRR